MNMNERIRTHVEGIFEGAPMTRKILDLKEELLANLNSKYDDLVAGGTSPDDAYRTVIAGIGDVSELVRQIQNESAFNKSIPSSARKRSAIFVSVAVALYILAPFSAILVTGNMGPFFMFLLIAVATGLLIYNGMTSPKYIKEEDSMVEDFKEWKSGTNEKKTFRKTLSLILWSLIVIVYFAINFFFFAWAYSWIIFIIGVFCEGIISLVLDMKKR